MTVPESPLSASKDLARTIPVSDHIKDEKKTLKVSPPADEKEKAAEDADAAGQIQTSKTGKNETSSKINDEITQKTGEAKQDVDVGTGI